MRIVAPFRPFPPESPAHRKLGPFDWIGALGMQRESARRTAGVEAIAITDVDTDLPGPSLKYETRHRRLMLWILEVSLRYIESGDFDRDTVMISPDILVLGDPRRWLGDYDLGVTIRTAERYAERPLINSVQFWRPHAKEKLAAFYRSALAVAEALPDAAIRWGADTIPLVQLLSPLALGVQDRAGIRVKMFEYNDVVVGPKIPPETARQLRRLVDFKNQAKLGMRDYYGRAFS